ncbi:MAG: outer membrane lipoprotein chaperone LolA [Bacteriovorax sp.]|nr:outer membrane lipoprotein chaperone LolA [Rhizobacter sp.]
MKKALIAATLGFVSLLAHADAVDTLKDFIRDVKTGRAQFTQTVTSPDGAKKKASSGSFEFARPNHFRFAYSKPFEQLIVADGQKVWIFDADLNQASSRKFSSALGATPAALLAGGSLDKDFDLAPVSVNDAAKDGLAWVQATPKLKEGAFKSVRVGFRGKDLAAVEIIDAFDQRSLLQFSQFVAGVKFPDDTFRFTPPAGADVIEQ